MQVSTPGRGSRTRPAGQQDGPPPGREQLERGRALSSSPSGAKRLMHFLRRLANPHTALAQWFALAVLGFAVYHTSLGNGFVVDDDQQIHHNPLVQSLANAPRVFLAGSFNPGGGGETGFYYKPVMTLSFALLYAAFGPGAFSFHLAQLGLHLANAGLVLLLFRRLLPAGGRGGVAFGLALLFLLHPINSEAVLYVSDLQDVLYFFFGMLALLLTSQGEGESAPGQGVSARRIAGAAGVGVCLLLSLLSKETGLLFVAMVASYPVLVARQGTPRVALGAVAAVAAWAVLRFGVARLGVAASTVAPISTASLPERLINVPYIIWYYTRTLLFPKDLGFVEAWMVRTMDVQHFYAPLALVLALAGGGVAWTWLIFSRRPAQRGVFAFFGLWLLAGLGLHLHLVVPLDMTVADRWAYFPLVGLLGMVGVTAPRADRLRRETRALCTALAIVLLAALAVRTYLRTFDWRDDLTLFSRAVLNPEQNFFAEMGLGAALSSAGRPAEAQVHLERSIAMYPNTLNWHFACVNRARLGDVDGALQACQRALELGAMFRTYQVAGALLAGYRDPALARAFIARGLERFPGNGRLWLFLAVAEYRLGRVEAAMEAARRAYELAPGPDTEQVYATLARGLPLRVTIQP